MATTHAQNASNDSLQQPQSTEFEQRRAGLIGEIGESLEQVLAQINALNRGLEGIIEIGNEFASVEALWSQFENVMGRNDEDPQSNADEDVDGNGEEETEINTKEPGDGGRNGKL